jgi:hypothetical protein
MRKKNKISFIKMEDTLTFDVEKCLQVAVSGESERGSDGVVWYDLNENKIQYLTSSEVEPKELRDSVRDLLSDDENANFIILVKQDMKVDITKVKKKFIQHDN